MGDGYDVIDVFLVEIKVDMTSNASLTPDRYSDRTIAKQIANLRA